MLCLIFIYFFPPIFLRITSLNNLIPSDSSPYLDEANIHLLSRVTSREVSSDVHVIIADQPGDDVRRRDTFGSLRRDKLPRRLDVFVDVVHLDSGGVVRNVIVCHKINLRT